MGREGGKILPKEALSPKVISVWAWRSGVVPKMGWSSCSISCKILEMNHRGMHPGKVLYPYHAPSPSLGF